MKKYNKITFDKQLNHERKKHSTQEFIQKTINRAPKREQNIALINYFFPNCKKILCIGARDDSEVESFIQHGYEAIGIDVTTESKHIWKIDAHKLCELDGRLIGPMHDVAYCSHVLEHLYYAKKVLRCIRKIAQMGIVITLPIYDKKRGMDASHCTIFDIMIEPGGFNFKDFSSLKPYTLLFFERHKKEIDLIFKWG